ncbi:hypothetical protein K2Z84_21560 [Candidatus Binatia bacterium]|nr:hypothetical protein [Candidatus Binatia bacterium]
MRRDTRSTETRIAARVHLDRAGLDRVARTLSRDNATVRLRFRGELQIVFPQGADEEVVLELAIALEGLPR